MGAIAEQFNKSLWMPPTLGFLVKMLMGEGSSFVSGSIQTPPSPLGQQHYQYAYLAIQKALMSIYYYL
jgi:NAD dependent epimerase/dehydratase family enzyme